MVVKTSHGQEKDIVNWRALTCEPPSKANLRLSTTRCPQGEQAVGFSYVIEVSTSSVVALPREI